MRGDIRLGSKELRRLDVVYTSLDEEHRRRAVSITKRSIDVATDYGARAVVLHIGQPSVVTNVEKELKQLFVEGRIISPQADTLRMCLVAERMQRHSEHMAALRHSLDELVVHARARRIRLGIENRPAHEIAGFAEIGEILSWYADDAVGYWHDTGHAQVQANLGFTPHADWLRAYGHRTIGMHLHDSVGVENHRAPGQGDVAWNTLARFVPANAIRVIEVDKTVSADALRAGVEHLRRTSWI